MTLAHVVLVLVIVNLIILLLQAVFLWLGIRWSSVPELRFAVAVVTCLVIAALTLFVSLGFGFVGAALSQFFLDAPSGWGDLLPKSLPTIGFLAQVLIAWLCVKWFFSTQWSEAALATLIMLIPSTVIGYGVNFAMRQWLLEAYQVSTGAMVPNLLGVHGDYQCARCGRRADVGLAERPADARHSPRPAVPVHCPNCGFVGSLGGEVPLRAGDAIVAEKVSPPARWDVRVVRRNGEESLKRIVGLPGETIEIIGGDVFADGQRVVKDIGGGLQMWIPMSDSALPPSAPVEGGPRWQLAERRSSWKTDDGGWRFAAGAEAEPLVFRGRIDGSLVYNERHRRDESDPLVGDVKLDCEVGPVAGSGQIEFRWDFGSRRAVATVAADGKAELTAGPVGQDLDPKAAVQGALGGSLSGAKLTFAVRDGIAWLASGETTVATVVVGPQDAQTARGLRPSTPCQVAIAPRAIEGRLERIAISRDVYYRGLDEMAGSPMASGWGSAKNPATLGDQTYFLLGDNSAVARDSRFTGPVHRDALRGVVRWIYWPPSRWREF